MHKEVLIVLLFSFLLLSCSSTQQQIENSAPDVTIGFIGCSNTRETVEGYHYLGGKKMWDSQRRYGSGTIIDWSKDVNDSKYWKVFDEMLAQYPYTNTIWWELCIMDGDRTTSSEHTDIILDEIRKRIPNAVIYVSALADYTDGVCEITGTWGLEKGKELVQELDEKNPGVFAGPLLGPMTPQDTAEDGCHLSSPDGKRKLGNQMRLFFDAEEYSADEASIGYIGCSNTMQTVAAYWSVDNLKDKVLWKFNEQELHEYDSGAVVDWSKGAKEGNKFWKTFDRYLENSPNTKAVFWQLCIRKEEATPYEEALVVLEAIRERIPDVVVYVSPLPPYTEGVCEITGTVGIERAKALAKELDLKNEDVVAGPVLGPMTPENTDEDGCHVSQEGMYTLAEQMREFFDTIRNETEMESDENNDEEMEEESTGADFEEEDLSPKEKIWRDRIEVAMESTPCPDIPKPVYSSSYYQGPLTDTHLHIPSIPDWSAQEDEEMKDEIPEGRFGGPQALLGWNVKMSEIACTLKQEGTQDNFAFFPVYEGEISAYQLQMWNRTMQQYPNQFTPFIMSSGNDGEPDGFPTVDAATLQEMLAVYPGLFEGYGEIGLYARENGGSPELPPDASRLQEIYPLIRQNSLVVYFHLGEGHKDNFEKVLSQNQDINFIWHGDQLSADEVEDILSTHPNAYYGIDAFWGHDQDLFHLFVGERKQDYLDALNQQFDVVLNYAVNDWKSVIERHPDQVLWGIDRGDAVWNYDLEVGQAQVKLARAFIGRLDPAVQEKIAYKNAEKIMGARE